MAGITTLSLLPSCHKSPSTSISSHSTLHSSSILLCMFKKYFLCWSNRPLTVWHNSLWFVLLSKIITYLFSAMPEIKLHKHRGGQCICLRHRGCCARPDQLSLAHWQHTKVFCYKIFYCTLVHSHKQYCTTSVFCNHFYIKMKDQR